MERTWDEAQAAGDPVDQFDRWFTEAAAEDLPEPNAMTLATATAEGRPSARMVLLKGYDERGFTFFTNYESRKGDELDTNPQVALVFFWPTLHRQIRIEGQAQRLLPEESDDYYAGRSRGSQIGARASQQSAVLPNREVLEQQVAAVDAEFTGQPVPRPDFWGGFRVAPESIEFWQGRTSRLHDRLRYNRLADGAWIIERLSP